MRVFFPARFVNRHVGGNTVYTRTIRDGIEAHGIETSLIPAHSSQILTAASETLFGMRRRKHDVLHYSGDTGTLVRPRTPTVLTIHGVASRWISVARNTRQEAVWRARVKASAKYADRIITVSRSSAADIADVFKIRPSSIEVIHHGVDVTEYQKRCSLSPTLQRYDTTPFALFIGNLEPRKNVIELIKAFGTPELRQAGVELVIVGRPAWNYGEILACIERSPWVRYLGFINQTDKVALLQRCSIFVFPSLYEGFGFPVLEALAAGAPVATSRRGSLDEIAGPALQLRGLDADAISNSVGDFLADSAALEECKRRGPEWAKRFSWASSIEAHIRVYREVSL